MALYNPRALLNRLGITFDPTKLRTFFKEDMDEVKNAFDILDYSRQHRFSLTLNSPYFAPPLSGWTRIPLDTVLSDPLGGFDPVNNTWVVQHNAIMRITAYCGTNPINPNKPFWIGCNLNGGIVNQIFFNNVTTNFQSAVYTFTLQVTAGDVLDFQFHNSNPSTYIVTSNSQTTAFEGETLELL